MKIRRLDHRMTSNTTAPSYSPLRVNSVTFGQSDCSDITLRINPSKVTVFIGPNNGGKTRSLMEIRSEFTGELYITDRLFVSECSVSGLISEEVEARANFISTSGLYKDDINRIVFRIENSMENKTVVVSDIKSKLEDPRSEFSYRQVRNNLYKYFALDLNGKNRLSILDTVQSYDIKDRPRNLLSKLFTDDDIRHNLSKLCFEAFGFYACIDATDLGKFHFVGSFEEPKEGIERSLEGDAIEFYKECFPISSASDGTRAFLGIYAEVIAGKADVIFLDEPEAFLHPSLSRRLAQEISNNIEDDKQIFIATHSPSFLSGIISATSNVDIVRLVKHGESKSAKLLQREALHAMMRDPLLRSTGVLEALFHSCCVVVEGDGDSAFYREINDRLYKSSGEHVWDASFICSHSKQTAHRIITPLRALGIPTACILDIDWIKEDGVVANNYLSSIGIPKSLIDIIKSERRAIRKMLESADENYKRKGGTKILSDPDRMAADMFFDRCEEFGLFTVRGGELESWLSYLGVPQNKTEWIPRIFEAMGDDPSESSYALPTGDDVWEFLGKVSRWLNNQDRKGMPSA